MFSITGHPENPSRGTRPLQDSLYRQFTNPFFAKVLTYTEQAALVVNYETEEFVHITSNVQQILGFNSHDTVLSGLRSFRELVHPDDYRIVVEKVLPEYDRCIQRMTDPLKLKVKCSYTCRLKTSNGRYVIFLQQNIPLAVENSKIVLGLTVLMDISAFKKNHDVTYRTVLLDPPQVKVLSQGSHQAKPEVSERERTILQLTAEGLSEKQIATALSLSIYTVKTHRKNMIRKTGVKNSIELVKYGMANFLL